MNSWLWFRRSVGKLRSRIAHRPLPIRYDYHGSSADFWIRALHAEHGHEIGSIVAEAIQATETCYVLDITVFEQFQFRGIARELLKRALVQSQCSTIVPVGIDLDGLTFWPRMARSRQIPVRLGLSRSELQAVQFGLRKMPAPVTEQNMPERASS